jgi:hypothetical protein
MSGICTSHFTGAQISYSYIQGLSEAYTSASYSSTILSGTTSYYTSVLTYSGSATVSTVLDVTSLSWQLVITAPAISGFNFPAGFSATLSNASTVVTNGSTSSPPSTDVASGNPGFVPKGAVAGITVASIFAVLGIGASLGLLFLLMKARRRLAEAEASSPKSHQAEEVDTSKIAYTPSPGPAYSPHGNSTNRQPGFGFNMQQSYPSQGQGHSPPTQPNLFQTAHAQSYQYAPQHQEQYETGPQLQQPFEAPGYSQGGFSARQGDIGPAPSSHNTGMPDSAELSSSPRPLPRE